MWRSGGVGGGSLNLVSPILFPFLGSVRGLVKVRMRMRVVSIVKVKMRTRVVRVWILVLMVWVFAMVMVESAIVREVGIGVVSKGGLDANVSMERD